MKRMPTPFDFMRLGMDTTRMMAEAQMVITLRMLGMAGVIPASRVESARMVTEKVVAGQAAGMAMSKAAMAGASAPAIAAAGLKPIGRKTRANVRRLTRPKA